MTLFQIKWRYYSKHLSESTKASISQSAFSQWNGWPTNLFLHHLLKHRGDDRGIHLNGVNDVSQTQG